MGSIILFEMETPAFDDIDVCFVVLWGFVSIISVLKVLKDLVHIIVYLVTKES